MADTTNTQQRELAGIVGFFDDPEVLIEGMKKVRDANYQAFDAFTPFPVHGLEAAQGLKRSWLPYITFAAGLTGCMAGFALQYWTSAVDWPLIVGGKPLNSWPAFVPVMFELTILFAGIATVFGMFALNRLPNTKVKVVDPAITRDRFAIVVERPRIDEDDPDEVEAAARFRKFSDVEVTSLLEKAGASEIRKVYAEGWF